MEEQAEFATTNITNNKKIVFVKLEDLNEKFIPELKHDISVLTDIYEKWFGLQSPFLSMPDPKLKQLTLDIQEHLSNDPDRKIIILVCTQIPFFMWGISTKGWNSYIYIYCSKQQE